MPDDIRQSIEENAAGPAQVTGDSGSVRMQPLKDQIAADQYLSGKTAATNKRKGLRFTKFVPPGTA